MKDPLGRDKDDQDTLIKMIKDDQECRTRKY